MRNEATGNALLKRVVFMGDSRPAIPPFVRASRKMAGYLLRRVQDGEMLSMPDAAPLFAAIGRGCYELRISHDGRIWRVMYLVAPRHIVVLYSFEKKTQKTPPSVLNACIRRRLQFLQEAAQGKYDA